MFWLLFVSILFNYSILTTNWIVCTDWWQWRKGDYRALRPEKYGASYWLINTRIPAWPSLFPLDTVASGMRRPFFISRVHIYGGPGGADTVQHAQSASKSFATVQERTGRLMALRLATLRLLFFIARSGSSNRFSAAPEELIKNW